MGAVLVLGPPGADGGARAQLLDLRVAEAPRPGDGRAVLAWAESLETEAARLEDEAGAVGDEGDATGLRVACRRMAAALLRRGEELGLEGCGHVLAGAMLSGAMGEVDAIAARAEPGGDDGLAVACAVLARRAGLVAIPHDQAEVARWLRRELAVLIEVAGPGGPGSPEIGPERELVDALAGAGTSGGEAVTAEIERARAALRELEEDLRRLSGLRAYHGETARLREAVVSAARAVLAVPESVPAGARAALWSRLAGAAGVLRRPAERTRGLEELAVVEGLGAAVAAVERASGTARSGRALRQAIHELAAAPGLGAPAVGAVRRLAELAGESPDPHAERALERETRLAWRALEREADGTRQQALAVLAELAREAVAGRGGGDPMTRPAVVSALAARRRALDDLAGVEQISRWLAALGEPERRRAGARVLRLGPHLGREGARDAALRAQSLAELRRLGDELRAWAALDVGAGRADAAALAEVTGGRGAELERRAEESRERALELWTGEGTMPGETAGVRAALEMVREAAIVTGGAGGAGPGANALPGAWDRAVRERVDGRVRARGAAATAALLARDEAALRQLIEERRDDALGRLTVRLAAEREAAPPEQGAARLLALCRMADLEAPLLVRVAAAWRYAAEAEHARARGDADAAAALERWAQGRARAALELVGDE